jgi:hypothetical protein
LDNATKSITDVNGWHEFIDLLKTKVDAYLYPGEVTSSDENDSSITAPATNVNDANIWHEDDITTSTNSTATSDDTDGSDSTTDTDNDTGDSDSTTDTNNDTNSSGTVSDSFDDYVTLQDLDTELNNKFDTFESKLLNEIKDMLNNQGSASTTEDDTASPSDSTHNNQATW